MWKWVTETLHNCDAVYVVLTVHCIPANTIPRGGSWQSSRMRDDQLFFRLGALLSFNFALPGFYFSFNLICQFSEGVPWYLYSLTLVGSNLVASSERLQVWSERFVSSTRTLSADSGGQLSMCSEHMSFQQRSVTWFAYAVDYKVRSISFINEV